MTFVAQPFQAYRQNDDKIFSEGNFPFYDYMIEILIRSIGAFQS